VKDTQPGSADDDQERRCTGSSEVSIALGIADRRKEPAGRLNQGDVSCVATDPIDHCRDRVPCPVVPGSKVWTDWFRIGVERRHEPSACSTEQLSIERLIRPGLQRLQSDHVTPCPASSERGRTGYDRLADASAGPRNDDERAH
jgi:hypothetical protein